MGVARHGGGSSTSVHSNCCGWPPQMNASTSLISVEFLRRSKWFMMSPSGGICTAVVVR